MTRATRTDATMLSNILEVEILMWATELLENKIERRHRNNYHVPMVNLKRCCKNTGEPERREKQPGERPEL